MPKKAVVPAGLYAAPRKRGRPAKNAGPSINGLDDDEVSLFDPTEDDEMRSIIGSLQSNGRRSPSLCDEPFDSM